MQEVSSGRDAAVVRISEIIDNLIKGNSLYQERLNKEEMIQLLVRLLDKFSPDYIKAIPDNDLKHRIDSILVIEAVSGTLNDLTPEQMEMFNAAVEER
ncbi:hypothetical protein QUB80_06240 [Chlorogloeopsis sp. ULAP01]|uniref:hypothetical protein n=1 Tax=Chlorogloeopsis sp. ULAP01 TaxID=3056483 RepID=UPI0025AAF2FC|nr:hypothetical protein [Chlorogloeopsis sp. ULAP01]MDM9380299.1 hypothetical protein [Chlorogloeopsis sp. ULAP01]